MGDETAANLPPNPQPFGALKGILPDISVEEWEETDRAIAHLWEDNLPGYAREIVPKARLPRVQVPRFADQYPLNTTSVA